MEPEVKAFLVRIVLSLFIGLLWLSTNSTLGIMYDFAFIHEEITIANICFYVWFVGSLALMLWLFIRLWKNHFGEYKG